MNGSVNKTYLLRHKQISQGVGQSEAIENAYFGGNGMSTISEVITASYSTSKDAEQVSKEIKNGWMRNQLRNRLASALGRSMMLEDAPAPAPDAKGLPLKGIQLFGSEADASYLWIALLGEHCAYMVTRNLRWKDCSNWYATIGIDAACNELEKDWRKRKKMKQSH